MDVDQIYLEQISLAHQIKTKNYCLPVKQAIILGNTWARRSAGVSSYFEPKLYWLWLYGCVILKKAYFSTGLVSYMYINCLLFLVWPNDQRWLIKIWKFIISLTLGLNSFGMQIINKVWPAMLY